MRLQRSLSQYEQQAYQGAKMFYFGFLPISMTALTILYLYLIANNTNKNYSLLFICLNLTSMWLTFTLASFQYVKCNNIETTPVKPHLSLKSQHQDIISQKTQSEQQQQLNDQQKRPNKKQCSICQISCDYRTRHCRKCQVCIQRYDHHCFWIGNCVGRHNHRHFYYFLLFQTLNNLSNLFSSSQIIPLYTANAIALNFYLKITIYMLVAFSFGFLLFTLYLFLYHTMLICNGMTTWEHMRRDRICYLNHLPPGYNPFSLGVIGNIKKFFSQKNRSSGDDDDFQIWEQLVPNYQDSKKLKPVFNLVENQYYSCC